MTAHSADRLRPLRCLPAGRLAAVRGVLTDIDDTLTRDGAIEPAALQALHALAAWPVAAIVAENGAVMLRRAAEGGGLCRDFVADEARRADDLRRLQACAQDILARVHGARLAQDSAGRLTDIAVDHSEFTHLPPEAIAQVVGVMREHGLTATVSSIHVNGWIGHHDKLSGARWAVQAALQRPFDPAEWIYVGDSTNDQVMFAALPLTVGVANIARFVPMLTAWPAYVTEAERGAGFAEVAQALLHAVPGLPPG